MAPARTRAADERRLAAVGTPGQEQCAAAPADDARVHEDALAGSDRDGEPQPRLEVFQQLAGTRGLSDALAPAEKPPRGATLLRRRSYEREFFFRRLRACRFPSRREMFGEALEQKMDR